MTSFFDKLKKGMEIKDLPDIQENSEPEADLTSAAFQENKPNKPTKRKVLEGNKKKELENEKDKKEKTAGSKKRKIKIKEAGEKKEEKRETKKETDWFESEGELTVDIYQTDKEIVIQSAIAGVETEDLDISIENDMVVIKGRREKPFEKEKRNYFSQECYWGPFSREIILPEEVDNSRVQALIKQGVLTIRIPKIERRKKRKITVKE